METEKRHYNKFNDNTDEWEYFYATEAQAAELDKGSIDGPFRTEADARGEAYQLNHQDEGRL